MRQKIELLAPAGNKEIFIKAVDAGADAVYCGIDVYNARMNAANLTMEDLAECCAYAHERSATVHLTLNTLVDDTEISQAVNTACEAYNSGVDAILVQDMGLASRIHDENPAIPLHASTQMNVYDVSKLKSLKGRGFERVVLPRELTLKEISDRTKAASKLGMETEVFIHGAVCVCTSGLCLFSSMNKSGTRSGNRGLCAQPCRQMYELYNNGKLLSSGHLISPKDRSALRFIPELIEAGVSSLKIEGRMRDADYVETAVRAYRRIIDAYYDGSLNEDMLNEAERELLVNFNRGGSFTTQNLTGKKDPNFLSGDYVGKFGLRIGRITLRDCKEGTITVRPVKDAVEPSRGDYLSLRDKKGEIKSFPVGKVSLYKGNYVIKGLHPSSIKDLPDDVNVYLMNHAFGDGQINKRKTHIDIFFDASTDGVIKATARVNEGPLQDICAEDELTYVNEGRSPVDPSRIEEQLKKTGNTAFAVDNVYLSGTENAVCPIRDINELRRGLLEMLSSEILMETSHVSVSEMHLDRFTKNQPCEGTVKTLRYFPSVNSMPKVLQDADIYAFSAYDYLTESSASVIRGIIEKTGKELALVLPDFCHDDIKARFDKIKDVKIIPTAGSNIYNTDTLKYELKQKGEAFVSYETEPSVAIKMLKNSEVYGDVYMHCGGFVPWMQTDFCPVGRNAPGCSACKGRGVFDLKQETGNETRVVTHPLDCSAVIYGSAKYVFDDAAANEAAAAGYNVIKCYTEV